jgi:hypothetical protein
VLRGTCSLTLLFFALSYRVPWRLTPVASLHGRGDAARDAIGRIPQRIIGQVRVPLRRPALRMSEQLGR